MRLDERRQIRKASAAGLLADTLPSQVIGSEAAKTRDERERHSERSDIELLATRCLTILRFEGAESQKEIC